MPIPTAITDLSTTAASNSPAGSDNVFPDLDNYLRAQASFIALLRDGRGLSTEVSLASAATCDIGGAASMFVQITGTTTITSFGTNYLPRILRFAGSLTLTHHATTLILPTAANITTAAGDMCLVVPVGTSGWRVLQYQRASEAAGFVSYLPAGSGAVATTVQSKLRETVSVKDFGAVGDGVADDTVAINAAIIAAKALPYGGEVFLPPGSYKVTEINLTSSTSDFVRSIKLKGAGRNVTRIVPAAAGNVLLNMMGMNQAHVEGLTVDSSAFASQAGVFVARTTTSGNANNNQFRDVFFAGSYTKAAVVLNGSESSRWFNCRFENTNASANYCCFWTGGGSLIGGLQSITTVNGGTVTNSNNPNTDNRMFGCEFYAPYNNARLVRFSQAAGYGFFGCTLIAGSANNVQLVTYGDPSGGRFNGPVSWHGCHFEVFGTGNAVHYLADAASTEYHGISSYSGYYVLSNNTAAVDYDRATVAAQPVLVTSTWTSPTTSPSSTGTCIYTWALYSSSISFRPNNGDGTLFVPGFAAQSVMDVTYLFAGGTRFVGCTHDSVATALPTTGTYTVGELINRETPTVGQPLGWRCTVSGTLGTLNGGATTGSITSGTNVLTVNSATGLAEGQRISVAGSSGGPYYVRKLVGTTAYLDSNAGATVSGAAVSFSSATLVALANL